MRKGVVSVVLPIYGVEAYLDRCIRSVVDQTYKNLEIILVDDGSEDRCPAICDEWAVRDERIVVIHKENAGLGEARNTGINAATGEYICFFDSDDYVDLTAIEKLYTVASEKNADAVIFGFHKVDNSGRIAASFFPPEAPSAYEGERILGELLPELIAPAILSERRYYMSGCFLFYSLENIRRSNWSFVSERQIISEDVYSLLKFFANVNRICVLPEALYYYYENRVSLSRKYHPGRYAKIKHFYLESISLCKQLGYGTEVINRLRKPYMGYVVSALKQEVMSGLPQSEITKNLREIVKDDVLQQVLTDSCADALNWKKRLLYWAMQKKFVGLTYALLCLRG